MKRFTMKRITALVLALVMTLSLLPMTAWAEGTGDSENGSEQLTANTNGFNRTNGVVVFTEKKDGTLSCSLPVDWIEDGRLGVTCYPTVISEVFLAVPNGSTLTVGTDLQETPIGTCSWTFGENSTPDVCNVYSVEVPSREPGKNTSEVSVTRSWGENEGDKYTFTLVFDFTPIYSLASNATPGSFEFLKFFTGVEDGNELTYDGTISGRWLGQDNAEITISCPTASGTSASKTAYVAAYSWMTATGLGEPIGKWNDGTRDYNIYKLSATNSAGNKVEHQANLSWEDNNGNTTTTRTWTLNFVFDFNVYPDQLWWQQNGGWSTNQIELQRGDSRNVKLAFGKATGRTALTSSNCTVELIGYVGTLSWVNSGTELCLDSSSATAQNGKIKVTFGDKAYELPIFVYFPPFAHHGVEIYTDYYDGNFFYMNNADYDGIFMNYDNNTVTVPCRPGTDSTIYLASEAELTEGTGGTLAVFSECPVYNGKMVYRLTVPGKNGGETPAAVKIVTDSGTETIDFTFRFNGIYFSNMLFFGMKNKNGGFGFENPASCDDMFIEGWYDEATNQSGIFFSAPFISGLDNDFYLIPTRGDVASIAVTGGSLYGTTNLYSIEAVEGTSNSPKYFKMTLSGAVTDDCNAIVTYKNSVGQAVGECEIRFRASEERRIVYYTSSGTSRIIVNVLPGVDEVVEFPAAGVLPNDILTLTVKALDDPNKNLAELWRPLLSGEDGCWVPYTVEAINPPTGATGDPGVAVVDCEDELKNAYSYLEDLITSKKDGAFEPYSGDDPTRQNAAIFAWSHEDSTTGTITIIPQTQIMTRVWCWRYLVPRETGMTVVDQKSGFTIDVQLEEGAANAVTLNKITYPTISASRVSLIPHDGLDAGNNKVLSPAYDGATGVLTYSYVGDVPANAWNVSEYVNGVVSPKINPYKNGTDNSGNPIYELLKITPPAVEEGEAPYMPKYFASQHFGGSFGGTEMRIPYIWLGVGTEETYLLTWCRGEGATYEEVTEQVTVQVPAVDGTEPWMAHVVFEEKVGGETVVRNIQALPVDKDRLSFTSLKDVQGVTSHVYDKTTGKLFTTYTNNTLLDIDPVLDATFTIKAPTGAIGCYMLAVGGDGNSDPTYNNFNAWKSQYFWGHALKNFVPINDETVDENGNFMPLTELNIGALNYQAIGNIEYYYSADLHTRYVLLKWVFAEGTSKAPVYEYLQLDTSPYFCQWEEVLKTDSAVPDDEAVEKPTATTEGLANSNIKLVARIHPQKQEDGYGQYFFQLEMVEEGEGNVYTDPDGDTYFTIILPYSFMGDDWSYEKAKNLEKKPMITHFDKEFKKLAKEGEITGEYTERGIEFKVNSFSPFTLSWDETVKENTGGYPGGYYPVVTPTTPTETKPTTPAQPVTPAVEEVTVPVSGEENTIHADASVSGTTATIDKVDTTHLNEIIGDHVETGTVTIDFSDLDSSEPVDTVKIPADVVKQIADAVSDPANDAESLEIVLSDGMSIEFDATALANKAAQADGLDITISIKHTVAEILSAAQQQTVGDRVAFDINVTSGGEHITDMGGKVTIHAPYELRDGESAEGIVVYYVDDAGNREKCKTSYDSAKKRVNWETTHFSVYMIDYEAPVVDDVIVDDAPADDAEQSSSGAGLWIGVGIVALAAIVVVLAVMAARKKRK